MKKTKNQGSKKGKEAVTNWFFQMLRCQRDFVVNVKVRDLQKGNTSISIGMEAFMMLKLKLQEVKRCVDEILLSRNESLDDEVLINIVYGAFYYGLDTSYKWWNDEYDDLIADLQTKIDQLGYLLGGIYKAVLGTYFRNIHYIIEQIDKSQYLTPDEKQNYVNTMKVQMSNSEYYILYYHVKSHIQDSWAAYDKKYRLTIDLPFDFLDLCDDADRWYEELLKP